MSTAQPDSSSIIEIRPITIDDYNDWIVLLDAFNLFYKVRFEPNLIATTWQRLIDPNERIYGVIAWIDKKAVGFAHWLFHRSTWAISDYCQLAVRFISISNITSIVARIYSCLKTHVVAVSDANLSIM